jgi:antitoxin (DNA-binding transcriptional repressor) of toxin-antitoxin stability system
MISVNIAELKNKLSHYLRLVRRGESVVIRDRKYVIARIEPAGSSEVSHGGDQEWLDELESKGIIRRGKGRIDNKLLARRIKVKADVLAALLKDREESI